MILDRRIGRLGYLLGQIPVLLFAFLLFLRTGSPVVEFGKAPADVVVPAVGVVLWSILITAWRCHDYNRSLWSNFWTEQVPLVGPFLGVWDLITTPGSKGFNSYGKPPAF